jgi:E3 ubiquitin-protein ligase DOA10
MTNNTDVPIVCSLAGGTIDTQSASLPTLLPESKGFFTMIYDNRAYFYILVLIVILSYIGYQLYKKLFTVQKSVDNFQQLHEEFKPSLQPEQLAEKHENEKHALEDKLKELEQQIMNKQPHRQEPQQQYQTPQEPKHSQQMIEHNVDYSNQNNRIQNDVNEPRNMEDDNIQQYDLTEGELNNIVKELED